MRVVALMAAMVLVLAGCAGPQEQETAGIGPAEGEGEGPCDSYGGVTDSALQLYKTECVIDSKGEPHEVVFY